MAAIAFNHRVGFPDPALEAASGDVLAAIAFVRGRGSDFGIDPERIALAAYSAGGPMLSMAVRDPKPYVRCLVAFYAFLDLRSSPLHRKFLSDEQVRRFSPAAALAETRGPVPPIFVARAGRDHPGPSARARPIRFPGDPQERRARVLQSARRGARVRQSGRRSALARDRARGGRIPAEEPREPLTRPVCGGERRPRLAKLSAWTPLWRSPGAFGWRAGSQLPPIFFKSSRSPSSFPARLLPGATRSISPWPRR